MNPERDIREIKKERLKALIDWAEDPDRIDLKDDDQPSNHPSQDSSCDASKVDRSNLDRRSKDASK